MSADGRDTCLAATGERPGESQRSPEPLAPARRILEEIELASARATRYQPFDLSVEAIPWNLAAVARPTSAALLGIAIEVLPRVKDNLTADLLEYILMVLVDRD